MQLGCTQRTRRSPQRSPGRPVKAGKPARHRQGRSLSAPTNSVPSQGQGGPSSFLRRGQQFTTVEAQLWTNYVTERSIENRNALGTYYATTLLRETAVKVRRRLPYVDCAELMGDGAIGLLWAIEHFDPSRGLRFESYAKLRIIGAMYDGVRDRDHIPRIARNRAGRMAVAIETWRLTHDAEPSDKQLARLLRIPVAQLPTWRADTTLANTKTGSLSAVVYEAEDANRQQSRGDGLEDLSTVDSRVNTATAEWWHGMLRGIRTREQAILILYWRCKYTMKRIGNLMGLSESRVSQMHSGTIEFLRQSRRPSDFADMETGGACIAFPWILPYCRRLRARAKKRKRKGE